MLNKLIFANLTHRPVRTLLSVLAIAVEVTMILTLVGVSYGTLDSTKERARGVGADIVVRPPNSQVMSSSELVALQREVHSAAGAAAARGAGYGNGDPGDRRFPTPITGLDFPAFNKMSGGFTYSDGGDPVNDDDMIVDKYYARQKHLRVGSKMTLADHDWKISGIFTGGKLTRIGVKLPVLQELTGTPGHLTHDLREAGRSEACGAGGGPVEGDAARRPDLSMNALTGCVFDQQCGDAEGLYLAW